MAIGITTILPVYLQNADPGELSLLQRAIDSVLSQECEVPMELLIVDDGSEPAAESLGFSNPKIRHLRMARNYGIAHALNAGITQARYQWIARIDADDYWRPGKLSRQVAMMNADSQLTLVASSLRVVHTGRPELDRDEMRGGDWAHALALTERIGCPFPHASILARRDVFEQLGGYPEAASAQHAEDFALWAEWMRFFKVAICDDVLVEYIISERQISSRFAKEQERASARPRHLLSVLPDRTRVPGAVGEVAAALGMGTFETGKYLFRAWKYYEDIAVDSALFEAAMTIFADRGVHRMEEVSTSLADRFFYLHRGPVSSDAFSSARVVATVPE